MISGRMLFPLSTPGARLRENALIATVNLSGGRLPLCVISDIALRPLREDADVVFRKDLVQVGATYSYARDDPT